MEANKIKDLINFKSYFRYIKKGFVFSVLLGILSWIVGWVLKLVNGGFQLKIDSMAQLMQLRGTLMIAFALAVIVTYLTIGFTVEYVSNSNNKLFKWVNK
ncbi:MAG: hypothetical protein AABY22_11800 [Nanoarchaeota archaeon]